MAHARITLLTCLLSLGVAGQALATPAPGLKEVKSLKVGGEGGWDYITLDPEAGRIYLPRSNRVTVLDLEGNSKGVIADTAGVHGVALAPALDRGWTSNGRANTVTVFKLSTLEVLQTIKTTGNNPDAIIYEPATRQVFSFNGSGKNATVIDAASGAVTATLDMGGKPEFAVADGKGRVYVNNEDTAEIWAIDARTRTVAARWSLKPLHEPSGLAMDIAHGRLFSVAGNKLMAVLDVATGKLLKTLPIGAGCDGVAFDPGTGCAYAANGEGTVTVVKEGADGQYQVIATVPSHRRARTLAVDEKSHKLYLPAADDAPLPVDAKPGQRPGLLPGSFQILVMGPGN